MSPRSARTAPPPAPPRGHTATHTEGRPVTCSCGWSSGTPIRSADAGRMLAEAHVRLPS